MTILYCGRNLESPPPPSHNWDVSCLGAPTWYGQILRRVLAGIRHIQEGQTIANRQDHVLDDDTGPCCGHARQAVE
jgi:hypothetical protein